MPSSNTVATVKPQLFNFQIRDKSTRNAKLYYDNSLTELASY